MNGPLGQHSRPDESDKPEGESTSVWLGFGRVTAVFASNAICSGNGMMLCNFLFFFDKTQCHIQILASMQPSS